MNVWPNSENDFEHLANNLNICLGIVLHEWKKGYQLSLRLIIILGAQISLSQGSYSGSEDNPNVDISLNVVGQLETTVIARFVVDYLYHI